jgi:hypothetical protein
LSAGLVVATLFDLALRSSMSRHVTPHSAGQRLAVLARQRSDYRLLVGVPPGEPPSWAIASRVTADAVTAEGHGDIPLAGVKAFVVAYPSGPLINCELAGHPRPAEMTGLTPGRKRHHDVLQPADLEEGRRYIEVKFGRSALRPHDRSHYSTTLTNLSGPRVRVLQFAGYARVAEGWKLSTVHTRNLRGLGALPVGTL